MLKILYLIEKVLNIFPRSFYLFFAKLLSFPLALFNISVLKRNINVIKSYAQSKNIALASAYTIRRKQIYYQLKLIIDSFVIARNRPELFYDLLTIDKASLASLNSLAKNKKGVFVLSMHSGNWELGPLVFKKYNYPLSSLYFTQLSEGLDLWFQKTRENLGVSLFHQKKEIRQSLKFLKSGGFMTAILDQDGTKNGYFQDFLGLPVSFPRSIEFFIKHSKAPIVPMILWHNQDKYYFEVFSEIKYNQEKPNYQKLYLDIANFLEKQILRHPEQWLLFYDRFKLRHQTYLKEQGLLEKHKEAYTKAWSGIC